MSDRAVIETIKPSISDEWPRCHCNDKNTPSISDEWPRCHINDENPPSISDEWPRCHCNDENPQLVMSDRAVIVTMKTPN